MSKREQRRAWVLSRVEAEEMSVAEAARLLGLTERSVRRLRARMASSPSWITCGSFAATS